MSSEQAHVEEWLNAVSHGVGWLLSAVGLGLLVRAYWQASVPAFAGAVAFGTALVAMYGASTLYHGWPEGPVKRWLRRVDHATIFLLIAATYTPFTLAVLEPAWGLPAFGTVWAIAGTGAVWKFVDVDGLPGPNYAVYLVLGWIAVVLMYPLATALPTAAFLLLIAGGLAYSGGTVFYAWESLPFNHSVWHLFVIAGSACHYASVFAIAGG
ncbi:MAG: hemolysin III family protein [Bradymonadaceae bacterium]